MLEALVATALFAMLVGLVLSEIEASRMRQVGYLQKEEAYQVAKMALQSGADRLTVNGQTVEVSRGEKTLIVRQEGEVLVAITKD